MRFGVIDGLADAVVLRLYLRFGVDIVSDALVIQRLPDLLHRSEFVDCRIRNDHDLFCAHILHVHAYFFGTTWSKPD